MQRACMQRCHSFAAGRPSPASAERSGLQTIRPSARVPHPQHFRAPLRCRPSLVVPQRYDALAQPELLRRSVLAKSGLLVPGRCTALPRPGLVCRLLRDAGSCCLLEPIWLSFCTVLACKTRQSATTNILQK